jgi:hypothetical protein
MAAARLTICWRVWNASSTIFITMISVIGSCSDGSGFQRPQDSRRFEATAGLCGDLQGLTGRTLLEIEGLEIPLLAG